MPPLLKKKKKRVLRCCVPHCDSVEQSFGDDDNGIKLYKFPADKPLMRKWVAQIGRGPNFIPTDRTRICSKHFQTGRKSYKPTHVDYIPNIFWYNTVKNSEFCTGCRRKVCKCDLQEPEKKEVECIGGTSNYVEFSETEMFQLLETIEAETEELEAEDITDGVVKDEYAQKNPNGVSAILKPSTSHQDVPVVDPVISVPTVMERTNVDETIDCCVLGDDTVGEDILLRQYRKSKIDVEESEPEVLEREFEQHGFGFTEIGMECEPSCSSMTTEVLLGDSCVRPDGGPDPAPVPEGILKLCVNNELEQETNNFTSSSSCPKETEVPLTDSQEVQQVDNHNSESEIEWKRRERILIKKHKAEEKRLVLEMIKNNQIKNQTIEELKKRVKELKQNEKSQHLATIEFEKKIRAEYEDLRKADIKNILDEANKNLLVLQTTWTEEKRVLIEANSALAKLCNGEVGLLNDLQAEFMCSVISACSSSQAGIPSVPRHEAQPSSQHPPLKTLRFESCSESNELIKYFTGIPTVQDFNELYSLLEPNATKMSYWNGKSWTANPAGTKKIKSSKIDIKNRLFLTLTRYRRGFATKELGFFFNCDATYISCLFITFSKLMENDFVDLFLKKYQYTQEFSELPEIVQTHYTKLYATLRVVEIRLENHVTFINSKSSIKPNPTKSSPPSYKILFLCSPNGNIFFISTVFSRTTTDREVILGSKVLDIIPEGSEVFVEQQFDVENECLAKQVQLLVFSQEITPTKLTEDDPWEIKLLTKCKSRIEKLVGLMRYFGIFDKGIHVGGNKGHAPTVIRVVLLLQHYIDNYCRAPEPPPPQPKLLTAVIVPSSSF